MKKRLEERLKDIIIDHIYNYCYNEVVKTLAGEDYAEQDKIPSEEDPFMRKMYDAYIKPSPAVKIFHDIRTATQCRILEGKMIQQSFSRKLLALGYRDSNELNSEVAKALDFLVRRSFLVQKLSGISEFSLTPKGIDHFSTGKSFELVYINGRLVRIALILSIISFIASLGAIALTLRPFV